jgi:hypothetical protein
MKKIAENATSVTNPNFEQTWFHVLAEVKSPSFTTCGMIHYCLIILTFLFILGLLSLGTKFFVDNLDNL